MRITGGKFKGRILLKGSEGTRPLRDSLRKSIFDILGELRGADVLDLFAGTGSFGIEALSRGAGKVVFVDSSLLAIKTVKMNLNKLGVEGRILKCRAEEALGRLKGEKFDLVFIDPPFEMKFSRGFFKHVRNVMRGGALAVVHRRKGTEEDYSPLGMEEKRLFQDSLVIFLRKK